MVELVQIWVVLGAFLRQERREETALHVPHLVEGRVGLVWRVEGACLSQAAEASAVGQASKEVLALKEVVACGAPPSQAEQVASVSQGMALAL